MRDQHLGHARAIPEADDARTYIVATEVGLLTGLRKRYPDRTFVAASDYAVCPNMKLTTLESAIVALREVSGEVVVAPEIGEKALRAVRADGRVARTSGTNRARPYIANVAGQKLHRRTFDVLVLGGGIAGLTAAISAARRWRAGLLTKAGFDDTTTFLAQGGIAAAIGESDSPELHFQDTVKAGAGLCDEDAVRVLVDEGPDRVRELMQICPHFDRVDGEIVLGREGAHSVAPRRPRRW